MWISKKRFEALEEGYDKRIKNLEKRAQGLEDDQQVHLGTFPTECRHAGMYSFSPGSHDIRAKVLLSQIVDHLGLELEITPAAGEVRKLVKVDKRRKK